MNQNRPGAARGKSPGPAGELIRNPGPPSREEPSSSDPRVDLFVSWLSAHDRFDHRAAITAARELRQLGVVVTVATRQPGGRP